MSYKLMAERLGVTYQAVKQRHQRALLVMRLRMAAA
jgi:DNA-directed RNA polymerase specialized sigma24 family protein